MSPTFSPPLFLALPAADAGPLIRPKNIDVKYINQFILWPVCLLNEVSIDAMACLNCICVAIVAAAAVAAVTAIIVVQHTNCVNIYDSMGNKMQCTLARSLTSNDH